MSYVPVRVLHALLRHTLPFADPDPRSGLDRVIIEQRGEYLTVRAASRFGAAIARHATGEEPIRAQVDLETAGAILKTFPSKRSTPSANEPVVHLNVDADRLTARGPGADGRTIAETWRMRLEHPDVADPLPLIEKAILDVREVDGARPHVRVAPAHLAALGSVLATAHERIKTMAWHHPVSPHSPMVATIGHDFIAIFMPARGGLRDPEETGDDLQTLDSWLNL